MRAGTLRQIITIQSKTGSGGEFTWSNHAANIRAKAQPLSGRELITAQAAQNETVMKFIIRYISGVTQAMRVVFNSKNYDITAVINVDERNRELHIMAKTGLSEG